MMKSEKSGSDRPVLYSVRCRVGNWNVEQKLDFAADWEDGMTYDGLADKYRFDGSRNTVIADVARLLKLPPRSRATITAWSRRARHQNSRTSPRECLKCHNDFPSEGPFNRICEPCKKINGHTGNEGVAYATPGMSVC